MSFLGCDGKQENSEEPPFAIPGAGDTLPYVRSKRLSKTGRASRRQILKFSGQLHKIPKNKVKFIVAAVTRCSGKLQSRRNIDKMAYFVESETSRPAFSAVCVRLKAASPEHAMSAAVTFSNCCRSPFQKAPQFFLCGRGRGVFAARHPHFALVVAVIALASIAGVGLTWTAGVNYQIREMQDCVMQ